jgi:hypothetical protein
MADWPTDLTINRRGTENAEKIHKNLCELGVSAVILTRNVKFVSEPARLLWSTIFAVFLMGRGFSRIARIFTNFLKLYPFDPRDPRPIFLVMSKVQT